jgi:hypothetical protein
MKMKSGNFGQFMTQLNMLIGAKCKRIPPLLILSHLPGQFLLMKRSLRRVVIDKELMENWELARKGMPLGQIAPLAER